MAKKAKKVRAKNAEEISPAVHETTEEEWHDLIDRMAKQYVDMGADEFIRRWKAGEFPHVEGTPAMNVLMLLDLEDQKAGWEAVERHLKEPMVEEDLPDVHELTAQEWHDLVDAAARHHLHMSADEFIQRWKAGEWPNPDGTPVMNVLMLLSVGDKRII